MTLYRKIPYPLRRMAMKGNDWMVSIFVGVVLSIVVVAFVATRIAGG